MRIGYIFIMFLHFMSYKNFERKTVFWFSKEKKCLFKSKEKYFWNDFFLLIR
jgi:cytochrome b subunit of formate dehydrogenase